MVKQLISFAALALVGMAAQAANSQPAGAAVSTVGAGVKVYDWLIGTWSCSTCTKSSGTTS